MKKPVAALLIGAALGAAAAAASALGWLDGVERPSWDWRVRATLAEEEPGREAAIVLIDQPSLDFYSRESAVGWPWPREMYVLILQWAKRAGARAVFFDMIFTEPSVYGEEDDRAFAAEMEGIPVYVDVAQLGDEALPPIDPIGPACAGWTYARAERDADGVIRRYRLRGEAGGREYPSIALAAAERLGVRYDGADVRLYRTCGFPVYSAKGVMQSEYRLQNGETADLDPAGFRGRVILVGSNVAALGDLWPTSTEAQIPGVFIHAQALSTLLRDRWVTRTPWWVDGLAAGALAVLTALAVMYLPLSRSAVTAPLLLGMATWGAAEAARDGVWIGYAPAVGAWAGAYVVGALYLYVTEGRQRRRVKRMFERYLSTAVVRKLLDRYDPVRLQGDRKPLTVFFLDFVGFTSISEKMDPMRLVQELNRYHTIAQEEIDREEGTLDKFIGDAVMAFWGDPVEHGDHARRGCRAAIRIRERLIELAKRLSAEGGVEFSARIGINTGDAVVGDTGSERHRNYTAIGDEVNLASRLEGLNRTFGTEILVSERTRRDAGDAVEAREVVLVRVKGRKTVERVFELAGPREDDAWRRALADFRAGRFAEARAAFAARPDDRVARFYVDWIDKVKAPPGGWQGVYDATSK